MRSVNGVIPSPAFRSTVLIFCLLSPVFCLLPAPAWALQTCTQSAAFTIDNRPGVGTLIGSVVGVDAQGKAQGALAGATVSVSGVGSVTTNSQGGYTVANVQEGTYAVTVSKSEYLPAFKDVTLRAGETKSETFTLTAQSTSGAPVASNFSSPNGKHFIEGMPGTLTFSTDVAWNGSPGSVRFYVAGTWYSAAIQDLGGGKARAALTIAAPSAIGRCTEWTIEVTNGAGKKVYVNTGVHFSPIPGIVIPWYRDNIRWTPSGLSLSCVSEASEGWTIPILGGSADFYLKFFRGDRREMKYDLLGGTLKSSWGGFGTFGFSSGLDGFELIAQGRQDAGGALAVSFVGCEAPTITASWNIALSGKGGIGAPVVILVELLYPPSAAIIEPPRHWPIVKDIMNALKLRLFVVGGLGLAGEYVPGSTPDCFLGTTLKVSGTLGLEGQVALSLWGASAGVYAGGTGTPELQWCPDLVFDGITFRAYVGVFASGWLHEYRKEIGAEIRFGSGGQATLVKSVPLNRATTVDSWEPIGTELSRWGQINLLVAGEQGSRIMARTGTQSGGSTEQVLVENVAKTGSPSLVADGSETLITFSAFDPAKPWYESTDIGTLRQIGGGAWNLDRIADDNDAEFNPKLAAVDEATNWAAWERVSGDVSEATGPEDVAPHLEIVTARFDRAAGTWSEPIQITSNTVLDRDPLPVVFGDKQGVMWIQNEAGASPGDATSGDSLMFAEWSGIEYLAPLTLWSGQKGVLSLSFAADSEGEGYAVFAVDEDGDPDTKADRELYAVSTTDGIWGEAARLTDDATEDAAPVLIAVNGTPVCIWSADGTVSYTTLTEWNPKAVYAEYTTANEAFSLDGVALPVGAGLKML